MAVDFIIGTLLLLSGIVNVLALYAFRVTPSLQTRSNSFVVNLLVINVISCIVLAVFLVINTHPIREVFATIDGYSTDDEKRFFLDSVATLGALSLTLVIWDSHSAITDPLRYHSRLSTLRVGLMIAAVWTVGFSFGMGSYFWGLHNWMFTLVFCALIVAAPFCLICAMYWRIFREARENGLRMRQNGSSPLLQSALNLVTSQLATTTTAAAPRIETILEKSPSCAEGLTLKIDESVSKVASSQTEFGATESSAVRAGSTASLSASRKHSLRQMFLFGVETGDDVQVDDVDDQTAITAQCLLNKLNNLKLQSPEVRQVRSTPDLQRYLNPDDGLKDPSHKLQETTEYRFRSSVPPLTPPKHLGYMTSIRHRLSNASSLFKYREESRAARISILVVIMFLVSYIPYGLLMLADGGLLSHYTQTVLSILVVVLATISSPIIFAYRNKRVQRAIKRLLHLETTELLPSSFYSANTAKRVHRQNTLSVYKKNLVLKAGPGRKMQKLLLAYPKVDKTQVNLSIAGRVLEQQPRHTQNGYENYLDETRVTPLAAVIGQKRNSTTSTASTIRCEDVVVAGKSSSPTLLSRFGFIRRQSGNMQNLRVSV